MPRCEPVSPKLPLTYVDPDSRSGPWIVGCLAGRCGESFGVEAGTARPLCSENAEGLHYQYLYIYYIFRVSL